MIEGGFYFYFSLNGGGLITRRGLEVGINIEGGGLIEEIWYIKCCSNVYVYAHI